MFWFFNFITIFSWNINSCVLYVLVFILSQFCHGIQKIHLSHAMCDSESLQYFKCYYKPKCWWNILTCEKPKCWYIWKSRTSIENQSIWMLCTCTHCFILINWGCLTNPTIFFLLQWANLIDPLQKKKVETMEASQNRRFYRKLECPFPLAHLYRWEGEDFGQNIWD